MRFFLVLISLIISDVSFSNDYEMYCGKNPGSQCVVVGNGERSPSIYLAKHHYSAFPTLVNEMRDIGLTVGTYPFEIAGMAPIHVKGPYNIVDVERDEGIFASVPDEQWDFYMNSAQCGFTGSACALSLLGAVKTGGLTLLIGRLNCLAAVATCTDAVRSWEKWRNYSKKVKKAQDEAIQSGAVSITGTVLNPSVAGSPSGIPESGVVVYPPGPVIFPVAGGRMPPAPSPVPPNIFPPAAGPGGGQICAMITYYSNPYFYLQPGIWICSS